jgi:hypothetical protein
MDRSNHAAGICVVMLLSICSIPVAAQQRSGSSKPAAATPKPAASSAQTGMAKLPIRRIVLYKNGVGYFEHVGKVRGNQELSIDFTSAQLNDVLKSLTAVDLGEGRITGVRYDSTAPLEQRMKTLRLGLAEDASQADFLSALRGAKVEVRAGAATAVGKILSVEERQRTSDKGVTTKVHDLSIVTDAGELRTFELGPAVSVRVVESDLREDVGHYLNLIGSERSRDLRRMVISDSGTGERDVFVGYISEVPVWKSTYRILLPDKSASKARLQGWAIVDNTVGEDWTDVQLSLVAGAAQSFVQEISKPYYTRRPEVSMPETFQLAPQSHEASTGSEREEKKALVSPPPPAAMGGMAGGVMSKIVSAPGDGVFRASGGSGNTLQGVVRDPTGAVVPGALIALRSDRTGESQTVRTDGAGNYTFLNVPNGPVYISGSANGFNMFSSRFNYGFGARRMDMTLSVGATAETVEVSAASPMLNTESASLGARMEDLQTEAEAAAAGDLFRYDIKQRITIGKNQSALVPIINAPIDAEKVTLWTKPSDDSTTRTPLRALWLKNTSELTLDSGTFNVLDESTFAGEGLVQTIRPGERRLISYAFDTAVHISTDDQSESEPVTHIRAAKGVLRLTRSERRTTIYKVHNSDTDARDVVIEHPIEEGWKLDAQLKPEETSTAHYRFRVKTSPSATAELKVVEDHPEETTYALSTLTPEQVQVIFRARNIPAALESSLQKIAAKKNEVSAVDVQLRSRNEEMQSISADQARVRENMKALKGSAEEKALLQRYAQQLNTQEDRLAAIKNDTAGLQAQRQRLQSELDQMVQELSMDETL